MTWQNLLKAVTYRDLDLLRTSIQELYAPPTAPPTEGEKEGKESKDGTDVDMDGKEKSLFMNGQSPLHVVAPWYEGVVELLREDSPVTQEMIQYTNNLKRNVVHEAIAKGASVATIKHMFLNRPKHVEDANAVDCDGGNILSMAIRCGREDLIAALLHEGLAELIGFTGLTHISSFSGMNFIQLAVKAGNRNILNQLLKNRPPPQFSVTPSLVYGVDGDGNTVFHYMAADQFRLNMKDAFVKYASETSTDSKLKESLTVCNKKGRNPLAEANANVNMESFMGLLELCDTTILNQLDKKGNSLLHTALVSWKDPIPMIRKLLSLAGFHQHNACNARHINPLHTAVLEKMSEDIISTLLEPLNPSKKFLANIQAIADEKEKARSYYYCNNKDKKKPPTKRYDGVDSSKFIYPVDVNGGCTMTCETDLALNHGEDDDEEEDEDNYMHDDDDGDDNEDDNEDY